MSYRTDQFYNLVQNGVVPDDNYLNPDGYSNPEFLWPGRTRKHSVEGNWVDKNDIQRGFIRLLTNTNEKEASFQVPMSLKNRRCFFQFNPSTIVRNVSMNSVGMMNPLLQDPSQFSAPIPGNAGFAFELMFDRSFELAKGPTATTSKSAEDTLAWSTSTDPLLNGDPTVVGVLSDLRVLDAIVGQGISQDMIDFMKYRAELVSSWQTSDTYVDVSTPSTEEGADGTTTTSTTTSTSSTDSGAAPFDPSRFDASVNQNIGNQAFLIPNPVRVLFSSLFMVDGFVTDMSVTFVKFNEAMVPMQCMVAVQMQAVYIGFAKKETFLTYSLNNAAKRDISDIGGIGGGDQTLDAEERAKTLGILNTGLRQFRAIPSGSIDSGVGGLGDRSWENTKHKEPNKNNQDEELDYLDYVHTSESPYLTKNFITGAFETPYVEMRLSHFPTIAGNAVTDWSYGFRQPVPKRENDIDVEQDAIFNAFVSGQIKKFSYNFTITLYRNIGFGPNEGSPEDIDPRFLSSDNKMILGVYTSPTLTANSDAEWKVIRKINGKNNGNGEDDKLERNRSILQNSLFMGVMKGRAAGVTVVLEASGERIDNPTVTQVANVWNPLVTSGAYTTIAYSSKIEVSVEVEDIAGNIITGRGEGVAVHRHHSQIVALKTVTFNATADTGGGGGGTGTGTGNDFVGGRPQLDNPARS